MSPTASNPQDVCPPLNFNPSVIDSQGAIYTPADCQLSAYVVITRDEGATYTWEPIPGAPTSGPDGGPQVSLAVDDADNLYALWPAAGKLYLAISRDHAKSWSTPMVVSVPGVHQIDHPTLSGGARGVVGITYYASPGASAQFLDAYVTQTDDALDPQPLFYGGMINDPADPIYHDYGLTGGSPRVDFIGGAFDPAGTTFWAGVVKQFGPPNSSGNIATTGYVGRLLFTPATPARIAPKFDLLAPDGPARGLVARPRAARDDPRAGSQPVRPSPPGTSASWTSSARRGGESGSATRRRSCSPACPPRSARGSAAARSSSSAPTSPTGCMVSGPASGSRASPGSSASATAFTSG